MAIKLMIQFNGKNLTIPINPEQLTITNSADNEDINIIGLGKATRKGEPGLEKLTIESFFPGAHTYFYTGVTPKTCVNFIKEIWNTENKNNNVAKLVTLGLPIDLNMYFVIENFEYDHKAGEEEDIYFKLEIKKYVPYGVKTVKVSLSGLAAARATSTSNSNAAGGSLKTYTVVKGDCLWNITRAATGNGARWRELYNINKSVIGSNPNLIYPGQVLTLPSGWNVSAGSVIKLTNASNRKKSSSSRASNIKNMPMKTKSSSGGSSSLRNTLFKKWYSNFSSGRGAFGSRRTEWAVDNIRR